MKQNIVAGGTYLNYKQHDFWLPLVRDRRSPAATTADSKSDFAADLPPIANQPQMWSRHRQKTVKKLIIFFIILKTV
jgi:hypothetical protein